MYKHFIRKILFIFSAETIHHAIIVGLKIMRYIPFAGSISDRIFGFKHPSLEREVFGIKFSNPVGFAAGFDKNAEVYESLGTMGFGFIEVGTITPKAQLGNPRPRLFRLIDDNAIINRMGFNNNGVDKAVEKLRNRKNSKLIVGGNLGKNTLTPNENAPSDYLKLFRRLYDYVDYFVINVSCPNISNLKKLQNADALRDIFQGITEFRRGQINYRPILLKISPDLTNEQIDEAIEVMKECNLDGIVATNTTTSREGTTDKEFVEGIGNGGLSGQPLTKRAIEVVRYVNEKTGGQFPIIGVGGIMSEDDAIAMLKAGASLIQVYTGYIYNGPYFVKRICKRIVKEKLTGR